MSFLYRNIAHVLGIFVLFVGLMIGYQHVDNKTSRVTLDEAHTVVIQETQEQHWQETLKEKEINESVVNKSQGVVLGDTFDDEVAKTEAELSCVAQTVGAFCSFFTENGVSSGTCQEQNNDSDLLACTP